MRLIQLASYGSSYGDSFVPMMRSVLGAATERGWRADALLPAEAGDRDWLASVEGAGATVDLVDLSGRADLTRRVRQRLAEAPDEPTILHTHFTDFDLPAVAAAWRRPRTRVFWHLHTPSIDSRRVRARNRLKLSVAGRGVTSMLCVAPHMVETFGRHAPPGRAVFFPNGIDIERFRTATAHESRRAREKLGVPPDSRLLVHFGWDWHRKGGDLLLQATRRLLDQGIEVFVVTRNQPADSEAMVRDLRLENHVLAVSEVDGVETLYAAADLLVSSSRKEGMPYTMLEALCSGVPVVATDNPGQDTVAERYPGCRLVALNADALAAVVAEELATDPAPRSRDLERARARITETMSLDGWSDRLMTLYEQAVPDAR